MGEATTEILIDGPVPALGDRVVLHVRWGTGGGAKATERFTAR